MLKDMEEVEQDKSSGRGIVWYRRKGDTLAIGEAKLNNVFYSFWKGEFESVWIDFVGEENFEALKKDLFERFGKALEPEAGMDKMGKRPRRERSPTERAGAFYVWWGKNTDIWLSYSKDRHKGTLTMNSRKIREERRDYEKEKEKEERLKTEDSKAKDHPSFRRSLWQYLSNLNEMFPIKNSLFLRFSNKERS